MAAVRADPVNSRCRRPISTTTGEAHDHSADVTGNGGGDDVSGVDDDAGVGFTATTDVGRISGRGRNIAGCGRPVRLKRVDVDDDVDDRLGRLGAGRSRSGGLKDGEQGVGAALGRGAFEHGGASVVADAGPEIVPLPVELGVFEPAQDLGDRCALDGAELGDEVERVIELRRRHPTPLVGSFVAAVGTVGVVERLPAAGHKRKSANGRFSACSINVVAASTRRSPTRGLARTRASSRT